MLVDVDVIYVPWLTVMVFASLIDERCMQMLSFLGTWKSSALLARPRQYPTRIPCVAKYGRTHRARRP